MVGLLNLTDADVFDSCLIQRWVVGMGCVCRGKQCPAAGQGAVRRAVVLVWL